MPTVRDMVRQAQAELLETDIAPARAAELLVRLTAIQGNCTEELLQAEMAYNTVLLKHYEEAEGVANRAAIKAKAGVEYHLMQQAKNQLKAVESMVSSLKTYMRHQADEMRFQR